MAEDADFYVRYYVGHKGKFGHEFLEFEFNPDGKLRYANNSHYKNETLIRKEGTAHLRGGDKSKNKFSFLAAFFGVNLAIHRGPY
jgi:hypothetical protein